MNKLKGLMIAACASNSGKTVTSLALICALQSMGIPVIACKSGPDYIDSSWLSWASGRPCINLDLRMTKPGGLENLSNRISAELKNSGLFIVEAAMGLYDGDRQGRYSAAESAARLNIPIILLLNAKGVGHSLAAMAHGYLNYKAAWMMDYGKPNFLGVICTHTSGESHAKLCKEILQAELKKKNLEYFGSLSAKAAPSISSRHLGLRSPSEVNLKRDDLAAFFKGSINLQKILNSISFIPNLIIPKEKRKRFFFSPLIKTRKISITLAIARDSAFSFCYADLPAMLKEWGVRIVFFSPLNDSFLPNCDCIYLPGGYPELYAKELSSNKSMLIALRNAASRNLPIYGECGGYIYLGQSLKLIDGQKYEMCKLLPPHFEQSKNLSALGYRELWPLYKDKNNESMSGHEFHYSKIINPNNTEERLWKYKDNKGNEAYDGFIKAKVMGAWSHLYPEGSRPFWRFFLSLCSIDK